MADSQELLQNTVFQLLSHNTSAEDIIKEVSSLREISNDKKMFSLLSEFACVPALQSKSVYDGGGKSGSDFYITKLLSYFDKQQLTAEEKVEFETTATVMGQMQKTSHCFGGQLSRLSDRLTSNPKISLYMLWTLHHENIFGLETYIKRLKGKEDAMKWFVSQLIHGEERFDVVKGIVSELLLLEFTDVRMETETAQKAISQVLRMLILDYAEQCLKTDASDLLTRVMSTISLEVDTTKKAYMFFLQTIACHNPIMRVSQAIREQQQWSYGKLSSPLRQLYKQLLLPFEVSDVIGLIRQLLEQQEVNWQMLLSLVSVTVVCLLESAKLFLEFTDSLMQDGLDRCEKETTIMGLLLARQACFQGPHVFLSYSDWFQRTFCDSSRSLAATRKSFSFLMKLLTDLVPYESAQHIKVHILHPPFVPAKCQSIMADYITLARTRLDDLKESLDMGSGDNDGAGNEKGKAQIVGEIENCVKLFETTGKVPTSILEASIFRKPYYVGQFLPALLQPRPLPDFPDAKMKLIAALKRADKIPQSLYTSYEKACKREASQLLEGVFLDSDSDDQMDLPPLEQLENSVNQLLTVVEEEAVGGNPKYTVAEVISLICERIETVLSINPKQATCVTLDMDCMTLEPTVLKVTDLILYAVSQALCVCYTSENPSFTWLSKLLLSLAQYSTVVENLYKRFWIFTFKQGPDLANHHLDTIAAILVEIYMKGDQLPWLQVKCKGQGHDLEGESKSVTEKIFNLMPVSTSKWMGLCLRLSTSYLKYMFSAYHDMSQCPVLPVVVKKFVYILTRLRPDLRGCRSVQATGRDLVTGLYSSEIFQELTKIYPLTVSEWIEYEISVSPQDDVLNDFNRHEYFTWIVYKHFARDNNTSYFDIANKLLEGIIQYDTRMQARLTGCVGGCCCTGSRVPLGNNRCYIVSLLQELTRMFSQCKVESLDVLPWLPQQLTKLLATVDSDIEKHALVQQFFRLSLCLPAYLMYSNTPCSQPSQLQCSSIITFINTTVVSHLSEGLYLSASISSYLCHGIMQVGDSSGITGLLGHLCDKCPILLTSFLVNAEVLEPFLIPLLNNNASLKRLFHCKRQHNEIANERDLWCQAVVIFTLLIEAASSGEISVVQDLAWLSKVKEVCGGVVQMLLLQMMYVQKLTDQKECKEADGICQALSEFVNVVAVDLQCDVSELLFVDYLDDKIRLVCKPSWTSLKNLTAFMFLGGQLSTFRSMLCTNSENLSRMLRAYCQVTTLYDKSFNIEAGKDENTTGHELHRLDELMLTVVQSATPSILRQIDQDLILSTSPSIADCVIRILSS